MVMGWLPEQREEQDQGGDGEADPQAVAEDLGRIGVAAAQPGSETEKLIGEPVHG
jgi:hypothetical protein